MPAKKKTARRKGREPYFFEAPISVLGCHEDGEWIALALEMDLRGHGETFQDACRDLLDLVRMQVDFAHFKGQKELIWRPAEPKYWALYERLKEEHFRGAATADEDPAPEYQIGGLLMPDPSTFAGKRPQFTPADA